MDEYNEHRQRTSTEMMTNKTKKIKQAEGNTNRHNNRKFTAEVGWGGRLASGSDNMRFGGRGRQGKTPECHKNTKVDVSYFSPYAKV